MKVEGFKAAVGVVGIARHAYAETDMAFKDTFARGMDFVADAFDEGLARGRGFVVAPPGRTDDVEIVEGRACRVEPGLVAEDDVAVDEKELVSSCVCCAYVPECSLEQKAFAVFAVLAEDVLDTIGLKPGEDCLVFVALSFDEDPVFWERICLEHDLQRTRRCCYACNVGSEECLDDSYVFKLCLVLLDVVVVKLVGLFSCKELYELVMPDSVWFTWQIVVSDLCWRSRLRWYCRRQDWLLRCSKLRESLLDLVEKCTCLGCYVGIIHDYIIPTSKYYSGNLWTRRNAIQDTVAQSIECLVCFVFCLLFSLVF